MMDMNEGVTDLKKSGIQGKVRGRRRRTESIVEEDYFHEGLDTVSASICTASERTRDVFQCVHFNVDVDSLQSEFILHCRIFIEQSCVPL